MRVNAARTPILVFAALTAVFVPLMTSSHAALGLGLSGAASATSPPPTGPAPSAPSTADEGAFYRSVLDLRPDLDGITVARYYAIGRAFCTGADLDADQLNQVQQAYAMPAGTLAYDLTMAKMVLQSAPMEFVQENQLAFGFDGSDIDSATLNAFRRKICADHPLWSAYADFVHRQLGSLGPWRTDPSYGAPGELAQMWSEDLTAWESALAPWLPPDMQVS